MQRRASQLEGDAALQFLTSRIDYERTSTVPYGRSDFRLDRMHRLLGLLDNPHVGLPVVHVAGTKGKGSTAAMLESALRAAGLCTGLYTSPHLDRMEERLRVDSRACSPAELIHLVECVRPAVEAMDAEPFEIEEGSNRPTYFEILTAMAMLHFRQRRVDAAILEVGLGGRLDSTNVCQPLVSVITSISFDHMQQLGNTLAAIAGEKAGIIKPGVPVVSGVVEPEPRAVIEEIAARQGCRLVQLGRDFDFRYRPPRNLEAADAAGHLDFRDTAGGGKHDLADLALNLTGHHQAANAAVAMATLGELVRIGWDISDAAVRTGLAKVEWPARIEVLGRRPTLVLDAAHNVASIEALVRAIDESFAPSKRLLIFATTRDKDIRGMLRVLASHFDEAIFTRYWNNPRGMPPEELKLLAEELSPITSHLVADAASAWKLARRIATPEHLVCMTGSFFLAAEMRAAIENDGG